MFIYYQVSHIKAILTAAAASSSIILFIYAMGRCYLKYPSMTMHSNDGIETDSGE